MPDALAGGVLFEALLTGGFFALALPFGYLSRRVKGSRLDAVKKWPLFLAVVHAPVVPLILLVKLSEMSVELEVALVAVVLLGHAAGVLVHRHRSALRAAAPKVTPAKD